jgi:hypothetical protein
MSFVAPDHTSATISPNCVMSTFSNQSANLDGEDEDAMSNGMLTEILRQVGETSGKIDDVRESLEEKIDRVEEQISGEDGLRDRVKALELGTDHRIKSLQHSADARMKSLEETVQSMVDKETTPITIHHTGKTTLVKPSRKDQATTVAMGGAGAGLLVVLYDAIPKLVTWLVSK